jgi:two-component system, cell cycle response regulator DivK
MDLKKKILISENTQEGDTKPDTLGNSTTKKDGHTRLPENIGLTESVNTIQEKIILVADDDDFNFFVIESLLSPYSYRIIHARNGEEAVEMFRSQQDISLILMDIQMPVMDGFTATKEIRKLDDKIPIIVQTAYSIKKVKEMAINCGCNDFLTKPIDADLLIRKIESCINN